MEGQYVTPNIILCPDGFYRWIYEMSMYKNPTIFITVCKVLGISTGAVYLFVLAVSVADGGFEAFLQITGGFLIITIAFLFIGGIAYLIVAAIYDGKYMVLFEMDKKEVRHIMLPSQFKKAQAIGWLAFMAGMAGGDLTTMGAGLLAAARNSSTSVFESVKTIKTNRKRNTIYVGQTLFRNQIYAEDEDFDFVEGYIRQHCLNAK